MLKRAMLPFVFTATMCVAQAPLPPNYRTIVDNADVLVQQVHYGPHETVPMHDHPAVTTVYVYLNDDKGFTILHEGSEAPVHRPAAHAGAFRVSPGNIERHAIENDSDAPSEFLRIELKKIPVHTLSREFRGDAPHPPFRGSGSETVYEDHGVEIDRVLCNSASSCSLSRSSVPVLAVAVALNPKSMPVHSPVAFVPSHQDVPQGFLAGITGPCEVLEIAASSD